MFLLVITFAVAVAVGLTIVTVVVVPLALWWQKGQPSRAEEELARMQKAMAPFETWLQREDEALAAEVAAIHARNHARNAAASHTAPSHSTQ
jgi:hypothetical protein